MKRLTTLLCLTLSLCLLSGCFVRNDDPIVQEADKAVQQILDRLEALTDQTKEMTSWLRPSGASPENTISP